MKQKWMRTLAIMLSIVLLAAEPFAVSAEETLLEVVEADVTAEPAVEATESPIEVPIGELVGELTKEELAAASTEGFAEEPAKEPVEELPEFQEVPLQTVSEVVPQATCAHEDTYVKKESEFQYPYDGKGYASYNNYIALKSESERDPSNEEKRKKAQQALDICLTFNLEASEYYKKMIESVDSKIAYKIAAYLSNGFSSDEFESTKEIKEMIDAEIEAKKRHKENLDALIGY